MFDACLQYLVSIQNHLVSRQGKLCPFIGWGSLAVSAYSNFKLRFFWSYLCYNAIFVLNKEDNRTGSGCLWIWLLWCTESWFTSHMMLAGPTKQRGLRAIEAVLSARSKDRPQLWLWGIQTRTSPLHQESESPWRAAAAAWLDGGQGPGARERRGGQGRGIPYATTITVGLLHCAYPGLKLWWSTRLWSISIIIHIRYICSIHI